MVHVRKLIEEDIDHLFPSKARPFAYEWLERQGIEEIYVAVLLLDERPVARVSLDFVSHIAYGAAHLWAAHTDPAYQSRGFGRTLFLHLEEVAKEREFKKIRLEVGKDNPRAVALYERLGYQMIGEELGRWTWPDGEEVMEECFVMEKGLAVHP